MECLTIEKVSKTLKSTLKVNGGKEGKEWKQRGETMYKEWIEEGYIISPTGLPAEGEPGRILDSLKRKVHKTSTEWKQGGNQIKGR